MTCVVKFTHLEQTLFLHSHQFFFSLKKCLELFLWREERNITLWNLPSVETNKLPFRRQEKSRNDGCLNVRCAVSLPHCFNVTFCL